MSIVIRAITQKDNKRLAEIIRNVIREFGINPEGTVYTDPTTDNLSALFDEKGSAYWIAEENGIVYGGCGIFPTSGLTTGCAELVKFYLAPEARGKGTGKALMQKSIEWAASMGYSQLYLESFPELSNAVEIYEKNGFKILSGPMGNSGHYSCTLWMLKDL